MPVKRLRSNCDQLLYSVMNISLICKKLRKIFDTGKKVDQVFVGSVIGGGLVRESSAKGTATTIGNQIEAAACQFLSAHNSHACPSRPQSGSQP